MKPAFISGVVLWFVWNFGNSYIRSDQATAIGDQAELAALIAGVLLLFAAYRRSLGIREIK
ncbi:hypothetical protein D3C84_1281470 [compost metagenome]